ncbi:RDD family protein [Janibacter sp. G368]|uniref:RDD family protein n=1 Tax=Janibacter sp. G368 TaxID=3420441 RepID=UPI003D076623
MTVPDPLQQPAGPPFVTGSDPMRPGSRAWVEQRFGRSASFGDRILPGVVDSLLVSLAGLVPLVIGIICFVQGLPEREYCTLYGTNGCSVPGTGSTALVTLGVVLMMLSVVTALAMVAYNRVWRVTRTGQSLGKRLTGLRVVDAETGAVPRLGPAALRELVHQFAGIISWIWMLVDHDDRTLADIAGHTHVVHVDKS